MNRYTFTVKEVTKIHGHPGPYGVIPLSQRRIRTLAQGRGIGTKVGGKLLFTKADVKALKPGKNGRPKGSGGHDDGPGSGPIEPQPITDDLLNESAGAPHGPRPEPFYLMVDNGGYCCSDLPLVLEFMRGKKIGDRLMVVMQYMEIEGPFLASIVEINYNEAKNRISVRFRGGPLDMVPGGYVRAKEDKSAELKHADIDKFYEA